MKLARAMISVILLATALAATTAFADSETAFGGGYSPRVPVSSLARPNLLFDTSRLHLMTSVSVGSGFGGSNALQVTRLSYQFRAPMALAVSVGNAWGPNMQRGASNMFLEGLDFSYRPLPSMMFQVHYQNLRSPLQYQNPGLGDDFWLR